MRFLHNGVEYELPDEWWNEAGMANYSMRRNAYEAGPSEFPDLVIREVAVSEVKPLIRQGTHGVFNDAGTERREGTARQRVLRILSQFRAESPVEPVCVARLPAQGEYQYELVHGAHRFYCAVAAGFSHVPAVEVVNTWRGIGG